MLPTLRCLPPLTVVVIRTEGAGCVERLLYLARLSQFEGSGPHSVPDHHQYQCTKSERMPGRFLKGLCQHAERHGCVKQLKQTYFSPLSCNCCTSNLCALRCHRMAQACCDMLASKHRQRSMHVRTMCKGLGVHAGSHELNRAKEPSLTAPISTCNLGC